MKASVIVLTWNGMDYLQPCLDALLAQDLDDFEVVVVDNASTDGSPDFVADRYPHVRLIRNTENLGFPAGCNVGLRAATGDVLVLLNQDTVVQPGWLAALLEAFEDHDVGVAGCKILSGDGERLDHAGGYLLMPSGEGKHYGVAEPDQGQYDQVREVDYVTGAALALRRKAFEKVGGFDEQFFPGYYEDVDLCFRIREADFKVLYWPTALVYHRGSGSFGKGLYSKHYLSFRNRIRFLFKHFHAVFVLESSLPAIVALMEKERSRDVLHGIVLGSLAVMSSLSNMLLDEIAYDVKLDILAAFRTLHDAAVQRESTLVTFSGKSHG